MIPAKDIKDFHKSGYIVIPDFKSLDALKTLRGAASKIVDEFDADSHRSIFTTEDQVSVLDEYFKSSGDKIRCFFEAEAFDEAGNLKQDKSLSINKIGHAMHDLDPIFDQFSRDQRLPAILSQLDMNDPLIWQSMYIFKQPRIGGAVDWHQDATFFYTDPITVLTLWFAIDDARRDNGCLWVGTDGPESPLRERFERANDEITMRTLDSTPWPELEQATPLEVPAGTLIIFKGKLPHFSAPNRSEKARHAYTMHLTDKNSHYAKTNWIQRSADFPARGF